MNNTPLYLMRKNVRHIQSYGVWRDAYLDDDQAIFLDNCENNFGSPVGRGYQRYPSSSQLSVKQALARYHRVQAANLCLGNGSDELIDLLIRCFCEPRRDSILICEPTFGMYRLYAQLNDVGVLEAPLLEESFLYDNQAILDAACDHTKLIFICSPNNPTGTSMPVDQLKKLLSTFWGMVIVDEAYIDFSEKVSALSLLHEFPNLIVLQTFSKAWGLASLRVGVAFGHQDLISVLNYVRPPFNISSHSQYTLLRALEKAERLPALLGKVREQKQWLEQRLRRLAFVRRIVRSDANFFLIETHDADRLHQYLLSHKVLVSNRSALPLCHNHIRISVGTGRENKRLIYLLNLYENL